MTDIDSNWSDLMTCSGCSQDKHSRNLVWFWTSKYLKWLHFKSHAIILLFPQNMIRFLSLFSSHRKNWFAARREYLHLGLSYFKPFTSNVFLRNNKLYYTFWKKDNFSVYNIRKVYFASLLSFLKKQECWYNIVINVTYTNFVFSFVSLAFIE